MANKFRGEIPCPAIRQGAYIRFSLDDLAEMENIFGENWFGEIESAALNGSSLKLQKVLSVVLKSRDAEGRGTPIWDELDKDALQDSGFTFDEKVGKIILDAMSYAVRNKSHDDLVKEALEAQKKAADDRVKMAKEVADKHGVPLSEEVLLRFLWPSQIAQESAP